MNHGQPSRQRKSRVSSCPLHRSRHQRPGSPGRLLKVAGGSTVTSIQRGCSVREVAVVDHCHGRQLEHLATTDIVRDRFDQHEPGCRPCRCASETSLATRRTRRAAFLARASRRGDMAIGIGASLSSSFGQLIAPSVPTWSSLSGKQLNSTLRSEEAFKQLCNFIWLATVLAPLRRETALLGCCLLLRTTSTGCIEQLLGVSCVSCSRFRMRACRLRSSSPR